MPGYTTKYTFTYTDVFGIVSVVNLKQMYYVGDPISLPKGGINYEFGRDRGEGVVRGSSASIGLWSLSQSQFSQFRAITDRAWMVEHIKGGQLYWRGWLTPEVFSEPFKHSLPYRVELSAVDGLGDLSNIDYLDSGGEMLYTRESFKTIIGRCLNNTQLGLNMVFSSALHPTGMTGDIFDQCTYSNAALVDKDGKTLKCSEVLERFKTLGITVKQWRGKWYILRTADLIDNPHVYEYDASGTYVDDGVIDIDWTIDDTTTEGAINLPIDQSGSQSNVQAYKEKEIAIDYGKKPSFFNNYDFSKGMAGWFDSYPGFASIYEAKDETFILLNGYTLHSAETYVSQSVAVKQTSDDFSFSFKVATFGRIVSGGGLHPIDGIPTKIIITLIGSSETYYLSTILNGWSTTPSFWIGNIFLSSISVDNPNWYDITILTSGLPIDGTLLVQLVRLPVTSPHPTGTFVLGVGFTKIRLEHLNNPLAISGTTLKCVNNSSYNYIPSKEDVFITDAPAVVNANLIYANFIANASGVPTTTWELTGETGAFPLAEYYLREQISLHRIPQNKIELTIRGIFDWCGTLRDRDGKRFHIVSGTLNERTQEWQLAICEILAYSGGVTITEASRLYNSSTSSTRTINGANDYRVIGAVGNPKQIHDLTHSLTVPSTAKIEIEKVGSSESEYITAGELLSAFRKIDQALSPSPDGELVTFTTPDPYKPGTTRIHVDGLKLTRGIDYNETDGNIVFVETPQVGEILTADYDIY